MIKILKSISLSCLSVSFAVVPILQAGNNNPDAIESNKPLPYTSPDNFKINKSPLSVEAAVLYSDLRLQEYCLPEDAFEYAYKGYQYLLAKNKIKNSDYLTICDFSQSSRNKRLYVIDLRNEKLLINTFVAHGRNSGKEYADHFSNKPTSRQSSLGFYSTSSTYFGKHGLALVINGLEPGINDKAAKRKIVIHGSKYVGSNYLQFSQFMGRSFGCPAVPQAESTTIINTIKNGSCFFIYHPDKKYLKSSKILNG
ncbi:MAG: murein L,D-transpeptidase catalytic domain family protein [Chitinophagales bacterium]